MPRAYSLDLRERVIAAARREPRLTQAELGARFQVSEGTVYNWLRRVRESGSVAATPHGGGRAPRVDAAGAAVLDALVRERNDRTLEELGTLYATRMQVRVTRSALWRALQRLGLRRKKGR